VSGPTGDRHRRVVSHYYELVDTNRFAELVELFHEEVVYERQGTPTIRGRQALLHFYQRDRVIAEGKHQLSQILTGENWVAVRGQFQGRLRNGESVKVRFTDWHHFSGDYIDYRNTLFPAGQV
jgi:uncharacterized protein